MSAHQMAVIKAVAMLNAVGAQFQISTLDGQTFESHRKATPLPIKPGRRGGRRLNNFLVTGYREKVTALKVGESAIIPIPERFTISEYGDVVRASASYHHGKGNCVVDVNKSTREIEVFRVL